ncbi:MAG: ABC transporter ATP-binding protein/permease [Chloroflexi bacterium]|nr:ABC transporter ATP-binding protein/permease [Chloroflexota bacterium]
MRPLGRALRHMTKYWPLALGAFFSMLLVSVANLVSPQLIRRVIDEGIMVGNLSAILVMAAGLLGVALVRGLFSFAQGYLSEKASQGAAYDMRNEIYGKLQTLSFSFHDQAQTGQLMTRVTSDVEMVRMFTGQGFLQLLGALFMFLGAAAVLILMNWRLALITLAILPLIFVSFAAFIRRAQPLFANVQARLGALNTVLQENLAGVRVVKAFVREAYEADRYARANDELLDVNLQVVRVFSSAFPVIFFIASLGTVAVVWYGGNQVIGGELSLGELVAFNTYLGLLMFPAFILGMVTALVARAAASAKRIFEIIDAENDVTDRPGAMPLPPVEGRVAFENVSFRYVGAERNVLEHASFVAEPGQTVAIVGTTGAGKSTIINLIPRFYDVTGGRLTIDGHDVRDVTISSLRCQIGIVLQDTLLFSGTIRENIAYGAPDASLDEIVKVAQLAHAHDFILEQPEGYNTKIGEGGVGLSGGQMQRIAIARALLLVPQILILDDSTSSVDAETEYQIQHSLANLMGSRTTFIIAQRISTVRNADLILVLDNARTVAQGTHEELLATSALYGEIVASQLYDDVLAFADAEKTED